eukprot:CAMPEP_0183335872 /NCGR_PEP_ID=MMETSP0164_2-20130417/4027_1 /TAXON_ID=221442 /ORGANISM="Coccolithus pelagicus ssp braarudi, Strain PLY182g" /LENGTH=51 /DNA_ID=CAMNT_0025505299 /DNA_START=86 /DNA_END=237 /DNA_ORIENTATION=+
MSGSQQINAGSERSHMWRAAAILREQRCNGHYSCRNNPTPRLPQPTSEEQT